MFGHARADQDLDEYVPAARTGGSSKGGGRRGAAGSGPAAASSSGPYDSEDPVAERLGRKGGRVDFDSLRIPIPARAQLQVEKGSGDLLRAVHVLVPSGRISLSALAAPRSNPLWRGLSGEIAESLGNDGARVRTVWGDWGREVEACSNGAMSRFIGVDGPRWMLYGVATGPADGAEELAGVLREMMRGTIVYRGADPLPVKTVLPLRLPEHLEENVERAREVSAKRPKKAKSAAAAAGAAGPGASAAAAKPADRRNGSRRAGSPPAHEPAQRRPVVPAAAPTVAVPMRRVSEPARTTRPEFTRPEFTRPGSADALPAVAQLPPAGAAIGALGGGGAADPAGWSSRPSVAGALPPVPAANDTSQRSAAEATWSLANPVVNADELAQQPAWALLGAAPSFSLDERYRPTDPGLISSGGSMSPVPASIPGYDEPSYEVPSYDVPGYDEPSYEVPSYDVPGYDVPGYDVPAPGGRRRLDDQGFGPVGSDRPFLGLDSDAGFGAGAYDGLGRDRASDGAPQELPFDGPTENRPFDSSGQDLIYGGMERGSAIGSLGEHRPLDGGAQNGFDGHGFDSFGSGSAGAGRDGALNGLAAGQPFTAQGGQIPFGIPNGSADSTGAAPSRPAPADGGWPGSEKWNGRDSDLLCSTDGLHAILTHDAAATRGWAARADRRSRHRQDDSTT